MEPPAPNVGQGLSATPTIEQGVQALRLTNESVVDQAAAVPQSSAASVPDDDGGLEGKTSAATPTLTSVLEDLVVETTAAVLREVHIQQCRERLGLRSGPGLDMASGGEDDDDDDDIGGSQYAQTQFGLDGAEDAERMLKEIDEKTAALVERGRSMKPEAVRHYLKGTLTTLRTDLPDEVNRKIDAILQAERKNVQEVSIEDIPRLYEGAKVAIWRGDITILRIDGIVNAANKYMLGCFTPDHKCIDNAIHCKAGPRLREACRKLMREQGHLEETGMAKITPAYNLPSRFVLHTVGPICHPPGNVARGQAEQLRSCYWECLNVAKQHGLRSVAFCCISTGVFGYPQEDAAHVALNTVKQWLSTGDNAESMDLILFNVFTPRDLEIYSRLAPRYFHPKNDTATATNRSEAEVASNSPIEDVTKHHT